MKFSGHQIEGVKAWVIGQVENISDADSDVLADYILALLKSDAPDDKVRQSLLDELPTFLHEHTNKFVDAVFARYADNSILKVTPNVSAGASESAPYLPTEPGVTTRFYNVSDPQSHTKPYEPTFSQFRKRTYNDFTDSSHGQQNNNGGKIFKSSRTGNIIPQRSSTRRSQYTTSTSQFAPFRNHSFSKFPVQPAQMQGYPLFESSDPMSAFLAMQALFPQMITTNSGFHVPILHQTHLNQRCHNYDLQGFCVLGSSCPYEHDSNGIIAPSEGEYDPTTALLHPNIGRFPTSKSRLRLGKSEYVEKSPNRSTFSDPKLPGNSSFTAIVVEQIPEEYFQEHSINDFFSQFGKITEINLENYKRLAIVKYETYSAARRAWESPKVIFDNRFVKVYWYRPDLEEQGKAVNGRSTKSNSLDNRPKGLVESNSLTDLALYQRVLEEKQKLHEQRRSEMQKIAGAKEKLRRRKEEMIKAHEKEKSILLRKIAHKRSKNMIRNEDYGKAGQPKDGSPEKDYSIETITLREQLAKLEAEAKTLGIDPDAISEDFSYGYEGRRGRGLVPGVRSQYTGQGFASHGYSGGNFRSSTFSKPWGPSAMKLDNRPKKIRISGVEFDTRKRDILRTYLVGVGKFEGLELVTEKTGSIVVSFKERWQAEGVMKGTRNIPRVGMVTMRWVNLARSSTTERPPIQSHYVDDDDLMMNDEKKMIDEQQEGLYQEPQEVNLDTAEDEWDGIT